MFGHQLTLALSDAASGFGFSANDLAHDFSIFLSVGKYWVVGRSPTQQRICFASVIDHRVEISSHEATQGHPLNRGVPLLCEYALALW